MLCLIRLPVLKTLYWWLLKDENIARLAANAEYAGDENLIKYRIKKKIILMILMRITSLLKEILKNTDFDTLSLGISITALKIVILRALLRVKIKRSATETKEKVIDEFDDES